MGPPSEVQSQSSTLVHMNESRQIATRLLGFMLFALILDVTRYR